MFSSIRIIRVKSYLYLVTGGQFSWKVQIWKKNGTVFYQAANYLKNKSLLHFYNFVGGLDELLSTFPQFKILNSNLFFLSHSQKKKFLITENIFSFSYAPDEYYWPPFLPRNSLITRFSKLFSITFHKILLGSILNIPENFKAIDQYFPSATTVKYIVH